MVELAEEKKKKAMLDAIFFSRFSYSFFLSEVGGNEEDCTGYKRKASFISVSLKIFLTLLYHNIMLNVFLLLEMDSLTSSSRWLVES